MASEKNVQYHQTTGEEMEQLGGIVAQALHFAPGTIDWWLGGWGKEGCRSLIHDGDLAGGLQIIWMGHWLGGRIVPNAAITTVGIAPEHRGKRLASVLIAKMLEELHEREIPISTLYPSTINFYRSMGYERAGTRTIYEITMDRIGPSERSLDMVAFDDSRLNDLKEIYERRARVSAGNLARHPFVWERILTPPGAAPLKYMVLRDGQPEGYVVFTQGRPRTPIRILDICALSAQAAQRILTFFSGHRTMTQEIRFQGAPNDQILHLLTHDDYKRRMVHDWMLRIVDVKGALEARGYPPGLETQFDLEVSADALEWNNGRYSVEISGGKARVTEGGSGAIALSERGLAALYTGHLAPTELAELGLLSGDDKHLAAAALAFSGPRPWAPDMF